MSLHQPRLPQDILLLVVKCTNDKSTLYRVAQSCRALSEPALRELWHTMDSIVPLLLVIPIEFYDWDKLDPIAGPVSPTLRLPRERWKQFRRDDPLLAHILTYGGYIKVLWGVDSKTFHVDHEALQFLLTELPWILGVQHIIPNLTRLLLINDELSDDDHHRHIRKLLVPSVWGICFTVSCLRHDFVDETIMVALQNCPKLLYLELACTGELHSEMPLVPVVLDLGNCLASNGQDARVLRSMATRSTSLRVIRFIPDEPSGCSDILVTPMTLAVLAHFKSITHLQIPLDTSHQVRNNALFERPSVAFPALEYLRLRLHGSAPVRWFIDALNAGKLEDLYLHFVQDINTIELNAFVSSLTEFREKFSRLRSLSLRATVHDEQGFSLSQDRDQVVPSVVTAAARLFPCLSHLKLKLLSPDPQRGLVRAVDLPLIAGSFPGLLSLKLATNPLDVSLTDIVELARRFPRLRAIGMDFQCSSDDIPEHTDVPLEGLLADGDAPAPTSGLCVLKVRGSEVLHPKEVAAYLRKNLPGLRQVARSRNSSHEEWDIVDELLGDRG